MKNYYYILGLNHEATEIEIKKAYRKLSLKFHPDKNDGDKFFEERFKEINEAYENLIDTHKRKEHDEILFANFFQTFQNANANQQTSDWEQRQQKQRQQEQKKQQEQRRQEQQRQNQKAQEEQKKQEYRQQKQKRQEEHQRHEQSQQEGRRQEYETQQKRRKQKNKPIGLFFTIFFLVLSGIFITYYFQSRKIQNKTELSPKNYTTEHEENLKVENSTQPYPSSKLNDQSLENSDLVLPNQKNNEIDNFFIDKRDNEKYKVKQYGEQTWMIENFRFSSPNSKSYDGSSEMGRLYMWKEAVANAPEGWMLPSNEDFNKLVKFLGGRKKNAETFELISADDFNLSVGRNSSDAAFYSTQSIDNVNQFNPIADFWTSTSTSYNKKVKYHYIFRPLERNVYLTGDITLQYFSVRYLKK